MSLWVVRAGRYGEQQETALNEGVVCHGWNELPDYSRYKSREELRALYEKTYPHERPRQVVVGVGQVWRFAHGIEKGDLVALPLKTESAIALGKVVGDYEYKELAANVKHIRRVEWIKTLPRSAFDQDILYSLGAISTVFQVERNDAEHRVRKLLGLHAVSHPSAPAAEPKIEDETEEPLEAIDLEQTAHDELVNRIGESFQGHPMAWLVEKVLKAQGYQTYVAPPGPDGGVDILAAPGPLGFEHPRICVQVKSGAIVADVKVLRELQGVMQKVRAEQGLLVSWGGFTKETQKEARDSFFSMRLWDQGNLVDAILANYEKLDDEIKAELPLKRIWVLVRDEEG
jgi:restriction system protein